MAQIIEELYGEIISIESTGRKSNAEWEWRKSYIGFRGRIIICMDEIKKAHVNAPIQIGDILIKNVAETGINVIATKNISQKS